jgi:hypothetical protein
MPDFAALCRRTAEWPSGAASNSHAQVRNKAKIIDLKFLVKPINDLSLGFDVFNRPVNN